MNATRSIFRGVWTMLKTQRAPSRRALAALAKLHGHRLERRWPFFPKAEEAQLNLGLDDVLEYQYARSRSFLVMVVGAYDGVQNDPVSRFVQGHDCSGIFVEPQPAAFARLRENLGSNPRFQLVNAAVGEVTSCQELFYVPPGVGGFPRWTEQLASFRRDHIVKHEGRVPGISDHIRSTTVATTSFEDLLERFNVRAVDVLQVDAEGFDAMLLSWFPFGRLKPGVVHYEIEHMSAKELAATRARLASFGYRVHRIESMNETAILV